jgi:TolA-binding protein
MLDRIRYGLAWIHFQEGNYNDAYKLFYLLSKSQDDSVAVKSLYWSGESKRYEGKYGESVEIHKSFVEKYPNHPYSEKVRLNIGISKFSQNSFSESEESLLSSINSTDQITKAKAFTLLGELKLRKKEYDKAADYFTRGLQIPQIPITLKDRCNLGLGVSYFFDKNNFEALQNFNSIDENNTEIDKNILNFYKGEANFFLGNFSNAVANYNKVITDDEVINKNTIYGKAYSHFNLKDFIKAAYFFNEYLKNYEDDERIVECQLRLADCYYGTKSFSKASLYYERALQNSDRFKNDERSFFNYAQSLFKEGKVTKAIGILNDIQRNFPASKYADNSQYLIGWIYFQNGNFKEAINNYTKLFSNYPQSALLPLAYYSIGDSYFNMGEYSNAISSYNMLIEQFPNSSYVYDAVNGIQYCFIVQDKQDDAINYLDDFLRNNQTLSFADKIQFKKGEIYYSAGNYESAISEYQKVLDNYSNSSLVPESYFWMGKSSVLLNKENLAIDYFQAVINNSLNSEAGFSSVIELGKIFRKQKNYEREIELYNDVIPNVADNKNISELKFVKAQNYIENNDISSAYQTLNDIVDKHDGSLFYHKAEIELGILELARSSYESSLYLFQNVVKNREDDLAAKAQYYIGLNYFEQKKMPEAITELIKVRSLYSAYDEWYSKALLLLGDSYVQINDKENAAEMYKGVLRRHSKDILGKEAKEKLDQL